MGKNSGCSSCLVKLLVFLLIMAGLGLGGFNIFQRVAIKPNKSSPGLFERKAIVQDLQIEESYSFPVSIQLTITPAYDIEDLEIQIDFLDSSGKLLGTQYLEIGDVESGQHYKKKMSITDLTVSEALLAKNCRWTVSRGLISFFG